MSWPRGPFAGAGTGGDNTRSRHIRDATLTATEGVSSTGCMWAGAGNRHGAVPLPFFFRTEACKQKGERESHAGNAHPRMSWGWTTPALSVTGKWGVWDQEVPSLLSREATSQGPSVSHMPGWLILLPWAFLPSRPLPLPAPRQVGSGSHQGKCQLKGDFQLRRPRTARGPDGG